ncbi:hypothetical protein J437_LFUL005275 [Ladona fulva]|uniref:Uncharacterized protein n=1 Tax=Ladona fulva TaxID=123851 RepID=A0A8K0KKW1_LADFU|nr:hypothetical protein J437_LFUL005275 [Ladona fulva]
MLLRHAAKNGGFMHRRTSTSNQGLSGTLGIRMLLQLCLSTLFVHSTRSYVLAPLSKVCVVDSDLNSQTDFQQTLSLEGSGKHSAARLWANLTDPPCTLVIEVPNDTHVIAVSLKDLPQGFLCPLNLWYVDGTDEPWSMKPCDRQTIPLYPEVFPHRIALRWYPEARAGQFGGNASRTEDMTAQTVQIVVTAVGRGSTCEGDDWVLCWKSMNERLCIAKELACDGYLNCPRPTNDESPSQCPNNDEMLKSTPGRAWDIVTNHIHRIISVTDEHSREISSEKSNKSEKPSEESGTEGTVAVFPRLGTWTLVLLVMLACGLLLLLCGLWECCCRTQHPNISMSPRGSTVVATSGATVYIISSSPPPQYDDLEQPPDYKELFPGKSRSTAV